jgi:hypothetical protein
VSTLQTDTPPAARLVFLDWVRTGAFGLLVLYHTGMYYVTWDWHVKSPFAGTAAEPWMLLMSPWRMDLLFLVSGAATAFMLRRNGASRALLAARARRLLLPLLFGVLVVVPPQSWLEVSGKLGYTGNYLEFMRLYLGAYAGFCFAPGRCLILPTWNHLWFLPYLFFYTLVLWGVLRVWPTLLERHATSGVAWVYGAGLLVWPVLVLTLTRALLHPRFPDTRALVDDWFAHSQYASMFLLGAVLARAPAVWQQFAQRRWLALVLALAAWLLLIQVRASPSVAGTATAMARVAVFSLQQWCAIVAVLGFALVHLNRDSAARRYLTQAVFPLYILHQTLIILLAASLRRWQMEPLAESAVIVVATAVLSLAGFEFARRIGWLRPWMGLATRPIR